MWLVLSHQEPQTQYKSEIKEKTLSRQESLDGLRISQKSAKTPLFTEFSDGLGGGAKFVLSAVCQLWCPVVASIRVSPFVLQK